METSTNLASVKLQAPANTGPLAAHVTYSIVCCTRSSLMPALENVRQRIAKTARLCGASIALVATISDLVFMRKYVPFTFCDVLHERSSKSCGG